MNYIMECYVGDKLMDMQYLQDGYTIRLPALTGSSEGIHMGQGTVKVGDELKFIIKEVGQTKEKQMSKFKAMKFWIGYDPKCSERVQQMLFDLGYKWISDDKKVRYTSEEYITTVQWGGRISKGYLFWGDSRDSFNESLCEEINIDWLRTPKEETIELNGKKCIKTELEEALKHINPVD